MMIMTSISSAASLFFAQSVGSGGWGGGERARVLCCTAALYIEMFIWMHSFHTFSLLLLLLRWLWRWWWAARWRRRGWRGWGRWCSGPCRRWRLFSIFGFLSRSVNFLPVVFCCDFLRRRRRAAALQSDVFVIGQLLLLPVALVVAVVVDHLYVFVGRRQWRRFLQLNGYALLR